MKNFAKVKYNNKKYIVCLFDKYSREKGTEEKLFVIDAEDFIKISLVSLKWHSINNKIGFNLSRKTIYIHDVIMNKEKNENDQKVIDHINNIPFDNRKINLRIITKSAKNENQKRKKRKTQLPENCGLTLEDIPRCVWYDLNCDRFVLRLYKNKIKTFDYKSTSDKKIPLPNKLEQVKQMLVDVCLFHPEIVGDKQLLENYSDAAIELMKEFNDIIDLSGFDCANDNKIKIPKKSEVKVDIEKFIIDGKKLLNGTNKGKYRNALSKLPDNCGVTPDMIPKYCYYKPPTVRNGACFIVDKGYPFLPYGIKYLATTSKKDESILNKFKELLRIVSYLEKRSKGIIPKFMPDVIKRAIERRRMRILKLSQNSSDNKSNKKKSNSKTNRNKPIKKLQNKRN